MTPRPEMTTDVERARPEGFDYTRPDPPEVRCLACNPHGMNRTGLRVVGLYGSSTTSAYGVPCESRCNRGLRR